RDGIMQPRRLFPAPFILIESAASVKRRLEVSPMSSFSSRLLFLICIVMLGCAHFTPAAPSSEGHGPAAQWPNYGNDAGGSRYSPLNEINRANVSQLKVAWTYHTGEVWD